MSREVDERVVEMRFDNAQFERNVQTSMGTLDRLKQALKLENSVKGFENLGKATKNFSLNDIAAGVEALQKRFSTFGIIGMRVLENLTDKAMAFASKTMGTMTNSIIQGGKTRAFNIENAHFQLQGLLKDEAKVQAVMKDAMDSVDGTAYAYDEAAKAASQFAASGLEAGVEMQSALRGITGVAAMTNSEYSGISEIFTTVAGNGRLMSMQLLQLSSRGLNAAATIRDYFNGVSNGSIEASESVTTAIKSLTKGLDVTEADIRDFVTKGNISFEMFSAAMDNSFGEHAKKANETFTGALSNVKSALARIGAEFYSPLIIQNGPLVQFLNALREKINEAKVAIVPLAEIFTNAVSAMAASATKYIQNLDISTPIEAFVSSIQRMATFVRSLSTLGALKNLAEGLMFTFRGLGKIIGTVGDAFQSVFTGPSLYGVTKFAESFKKLAASFDVAVIRHLDQFKDIFSGLFSVFHIFGQLIGAVVKAFASVAGALAPVGGAILDFAAFIGRGITALDQFITKNKVFEAVFSNVGNVVSAVAKGIGTAISNIRDALSNRGSLGLGDAIKTAFSGVGEALESVAPFIAKIGRVVANAIGSFFSGILKTIHGEGFDTLIDLFNGSLMVAIGAGIAKFIRNLTEMQTVIAGTFGRFGMIGGNINRVLTSVRMHFAAIQASLKANVLLKIAGAIAILAVSLVAIASIDSDKLAMSLGAITVLFGELMGSMALFDKFSKFNIQLGRTAAMMVGMAIAVAILAGAMKKISGLDWEGIAKGLVSISGAMAALVIATRAIDASSSSITSITKSGFISSKSSAGIVKTGLALIEFALAIKLLASSLKSIGDMGWENIAKGLTGIAGMMAILVVATKAIDSSYSSITKITKSGFSREKTGQSLVKTGLALLEFAAVIKMLCSSLKSIGDMGWENIAKGLVGMGGVITELIVLSRLLNAQNVTVSTGAAMIGLATTLVILANTLQDLGAMEWEAIGKGLLAMGALIIEIVALASGLEVLNSSLAAKGGGASLLQFAGAMLVLSAAMKVFASVIKTFSSMSWEGLAKGLLGLAGAFAAIEVAVAVAASIEAFIPVVLALSGALALAGIGVLAFGVGLTAIATGITALSVAFASGVAGIVSGLSTLILGIAELIPAIVEQIGKALIVFCQVIAEGAPAIAQAVKAIVLSLVDVLVECIPAIADGAMQLIVGVLDALVTYAPQIVDRLMQFLIGVIDSLAARIPELIQAAVNLFMSFFAGIVDALSSIDTDFLVKAIEGIGLLAAMMLALAGIASLVPGAMVGILGMGAVIAELAGVLAAIGGLAQIPGLTWLVGEGGKLLQSIGTAIGSFIGGIAGGIAAGFTSSLPQIGSDLTAFMDNLQPFIEGASSITPDMLTGIKTLTEVILMLTAADILDGLTSWLTGGASLADFGAQLIPFGEAMKGFSDSLDGMDADLVSKASIAGKALAEMAATIPNSGGIIGFFAGENDMSTFGSQLKGFGTAMMDFATSVDGLTPDTVVNAATAGKALAEMANTIPNSGGLLEFFSGGNDMEAFGAQLKSFGEAMVNYSTAVAGLEVEAISTSVTAAHSLVDLANAIPNIGGLVTAFTGDNGLDSFGEQLTNFGKAMVKYSNSVTNLKPEAIANSVAAGEALVSLSKTVPKMGGLISFFTGTNDLALFGNNMVQFGKSLASYSIAVSLVKPDVVTASANAASALSSLANGLPDIGVFERWFGGNNKLAAFGEGIASFGTAIGTYSSKVANVNTGKMASVIVQVRSLANLSKELEGLNPNAFSNFSKSLSNLGKAGLDGFVKSFQNCGQQVRGAVQTMMASISSAITQNKSNADAAMKAVVTSLVKVVNDGSKQMLSAAKAMMTSFSSGIRSGQAGARSAMLIVVRNAAAAASQGRSSFVAAGSNAAAGFIAGMSAKTFAAAAAGRALATAALNAAKSALAIHSPSKEFMYLGQYMGEGLAIGTRNSIVLAKDAVSDLIGEVLAISAKGIEAFETWLDEKKYYNEISLKDELAGWTKLQAMYKIGSEERKKIDREIYRVQNELVAATYQASMDWIDEEKYYDRLSKEEELAAYERVQARYMKGSEERKKADREVYRLKKELIDDAYQHSMNWIEQEKYYNRMSLSDELAAYKRVQSRYAKGTDERKKMDREVYRLEQEIYQAQKQYISDVQALQESTNQKRLDLEKEYSDKVKSINEQLSRDIENENKRYTDALESRTDALYRSYGLFDEVKEREEVSSDTLMRNLEDQVKEFSEWQDILDDLSARGLDEELIAELQQMGPSAISEIEALNSMTDKELDKYTALWSIKHAQARSQAVGELEDLRVETLNNIKQLRVDADVELEEYRATWLSNLERVNAEAEAALEALRKEFGEKVGLIKTNTEEQLQEMSETAQKILTEAGWSETGKQIVAGLAAGVQEERSAFLDEITAMAIAAIQAVEETLDINSPSRVFWRLGNYTGLGFINGLSQYVEKSYDTSSEIADSVESGLSNVMTSIAAIIDNGIDLEPTIRPVLDLSNLSDGADELNSLFGSNKALGLIGQASYAFGSLPNGGRHTVAVDNGDMVRELHSLRADMSELIGRMERLQVVMDTGTLVGALSGPMESTMGQNIIRRGRGI